MTYGIEIKNSDNKVIITEQKANFFLRGSGTSSIGNTAGTGYKPANADASLYIPNSGVQGNGNVLGSDFLFGAPSGSYSSTATVHLEGTLRWGAIVQRLQRRWGRFTSQQGSTPTTAPNGYKWFQMAPANANGFPIDAASSSSDYGIEIFDASGDVLFTSLECNSMPTFEAVVTTSGGSSNVISGGETWYNAYTYTYTAPSGANIYDYYCLFNMFYLSRTYASGGNIGSFGLKAEYKQSNRTIKLISSYPRRVIIARLLS
tara:strand:+ start:432 stop:1211 length:780 start_codon:yes stop_codon:yes gene_type:complete